MVLTSRFLDSKKKYLAVSDHGSFKSLKEGHEQPDNIHRCKFLENFKEKWVHKSEKNGWLTRDAIHI